MQILKLAIDEKIVSSIEIVKETGIDISSFSLKLSGKREFSSDDEKAISKALNKITKRKKNICAKIETLTMSREDALNILCDLAKKNGFTDYIFDNYSEVNFIVNISLHYGYDSKPAYRVHIYEGTLVLINNAENRKIGTYQYNEIEKIFLKIRELNN